MTRTRYRPEQIINQLKETEVFLCQDSMVGEAARKIGVTDETYYRWRREYGGMSIEDSFKVLKRRARRVIGQVRASQGYLPEMRSEEERLR